MKPIDLSKGFAAACQNIEKLDNLIERCVAYRKLGGQCQVTMETESTRARMKGRHAQRPDAMVQFIRADALGRNAELAYKIAGDLQKKFDMLPDSKKRQLVETAASHDVDYFMSISLDI